MKPIRYLAASLFIISGILHFYYLTKGTSDPYFISALVFVILYFALGILLIMNKKFAIWLGLIIPIVPLASLFTVDLKSLDAFTIIVLAIDLAVVILCLILLLNKKKS